MIIEGNGSLRDELINIVKSDKLEPYCLFVGEEANIMDLMNTLDVLILPSIENEDFPNVILEAMGVGKPVIASRIAGTSEQIVDGETGLLVEPQNANDLAHAIQILLENRDLCKIWVRLGKFVSISALLTKYPLINMSAYTTLSFIQKKIINTCR